MNDPKIQNETRQQELDAPKRSYDRPAIIYRAPLEATAGACTPAYYDDPPGDGKADTNILCSSGQS